MLQQAVNFVFEGFPKIPRLRKPIVITEKLDGTNAQVAIFEIPSLRDLEDVQRNPALIAVLPGKEIGDSPLALFAGSRTRWIYPGKNTDNFGFAQWVLENSAELAKLGPGRHFGEWFGAGIQRTYGLSEKRFALFNTARWGAHNPNTPACVTTVPVLSSPLYEDEESCMELLRDNGSFAVHGFKDPEGIVVFHSGSSQLYKRTFKDEDGKWKSAA